MNCPSNRGKSTGHNRPVHEVLFPRKLALEPAFTREFAGMTREPVALDVLEKTLDFPRFSGQVEVCISMICECCPSFQS